jgi:hypothetical protein
MDRIIFGDNQFFAINHRSEDKEAELSRRFGNVEAIIAVLDAAYEAGIHALMLNTNTRAEAICDHFRNHPQRYADLRLYPSIPYAHKYANAVTEKGIWAALTDVLVANNTAGNLVSMLARGGLGLLNQNPLQIMRLLVDAEMKMFRGLNVKVVFLQNIVTDLILGQGLNEVFRSFAEHIRKKYQAEPGFITMNLPRLVDCLLDAGIENPVVCSAINKIGYLMNPGIAEYERVIAEKPFRPIAMSILASGAVPPAEAIQYVTRQPKIGSVVFGASSRSHILQTKQLIEEAWNGRSR